MHKFRSITDPVLRPLKLCFFSAIALVLMTAHAEARETLKPQPNAPLRSQLRSTLLLPKISLPSASLQSVRMPGAEPTCYLKRLGRYVEPLDHLCGIHDPKPDRRRSPYELDKDGLPFVLKENYQTVKELQKKLSAAQQKLEDEMPFSDSAKQLMAEQKALINQYGSVKTSAESKTLQQRLQSNQKKINEDPTVKKSYEMMGKLYQHH